ncbi:LOW QUALITY PROTEIN: DNA-directed RNA polymerase III subunit RPC7-like [Rhynochetos jubatus]
MGRVGDPYPGPLEHRAAPLRGGEEGEYMLALKQELRGAMKTLPYFVKPGAPTETSSATSDKYQLSSPIDSAIDWNPDWRRLPRELKIRVRRLRKGRTTILIPKCQQRVALDKEETIKKLESLEKKEEEVTSEEEEEKEEEEGKEEEEEEYDEEEHEEETDYIMSYFDNGEDFGADSDDNMDEAVTEPPPRPPLRWGSPPRPSPGALGSPVTLGMPHQPPPFRVSQAAPAPPPRPPPRLPLPTRGPERADPSPAWRGARARAGGGAAEGGGGGAMGPPAPSMGGGNRIGLRGGDDTTG